MSATTRPARVPEATRQPAEVSAAWSRATSSSVDHVVDLGDRIALASSGRFSILSKRDGRVEGTRELAGCNAPWVRESAALLFARCGKEHRELVALDASSLEERWRMDLGAEVNSVTARSDLVLILLRSSRLIALAPNGELIWHADVPTERPLLVEQDRERVYVFESDPTVWAFDRDRGELLWSRPEKARIDGVTPLADGRLALSLETGVLALDPKTGRETHRITAEAAGTLEWPWRYATTRADDERWFRGTRLRGADLSTGQSWEYDKFVSSRDPLVRGDLIYAVSETGVLHAVDRRSGRRRWSADVGANATLHPLPDGTVIVDDGTRVTALDPSRPMRADRTLTVRGRYRDASGRARARVRIWVGDRPVLTGRGGRFEMTVAHRDTVTVQADPRDVAESVEPAILHPRRGQDQVHVELEGYYEDCH